MSMGMTRTRLEGTQRYGRTVSIDRALVGCTHALLKQAPRAPANAVPNGVSCRGLAFAFFDCAAAIAVVGRLKPASVTHHSFNTCKRTGNASSVTRPCNPTHSSILRDHQCKPTRHPVVVLRRSLDFHFHDPQNK